MHNQAVGEKSTLTSDDQFLSYCISKDNGNVATLLSLHEAYIFSETLHLQMTRRLLGYTSWLYLLAILIGHTSWLDWMASLASKVLTPAVL